MSRFILSGLLLIGGVCGGAESAPRKIPLLYSTDLFHPHADPDDHYDLACVFALEEFDLQGIVLDLGAEQKKRIGRPPVEQMQHITGRRVPAAVGLSQHLRDRTDKAVEEPAEFQAGVELILRVLRAASDKVVITTTGSCRDVAVAFNREPELLKAKVRAVYFNIGRGPNEAQDECNVNYDAASYLRVLESGLPLYWCPCFGKEGYETLYVADQTAVVGACMDAVRNYFVYCLTRSNQEPLAFLSSGPHPLPTGPRSMWCTAPLFHAAGRQIYQRGPEDFVALSPAAAERAGLAGKRIEVFTFEPMRVQVDDRPAEPVTSLTEPPSGQLVAAWAGQTQDRVGTGRPEPDGRPDCSVRVLGVAPEKTIQNIILTGPKEGRWEFVETGRWWRLAYERHGRTLDGYFHFWTHGRHQVEIMYEDGSKQTASFDVPNVGAARFRVELHPSQPNGFVFRKTAPRYQQILASCLKNLLAGLGR